MGTAIMLVSDNQGLKELDKQLQDIADKAEEKSRFLNKQLDDLKEKTQEESKSVWEKIEALAESSGKLPSDYSKKKYHFHLENGSLILCSDDIKKEFQDNFLKHILGK